MLTPVPTPDPKCVLNVTSFLTLPHPLDCPICAKDIMVTVLLLQVTEVDRKVGEGGLLLLIALSWLVHDSLFCLFHCSFLAFFASGPFN